jgi:hypothetical protein
MPTDVAQLAFASAGAIIILFLMARRGALTGTERNAVGTAAFGLFLCARHFGSTEEITDWVFTTAVAAMMIILAYRNLGFGGIAADASPQD